ncbi:hypothetical protein [Sutcliffiella horikoshii]|uniref:hypothetical protein n=1 Tax=Sutcliffiella horikoshii TaxID=79883 RepID=UPI003850BE66
MLQSTARNLYNFQIQLLLNFKGEIHLKMLLKHLIFERKNWFGHFLGYFGQLPCFDGVCSGILGLCLDNHSMGFGHLKNWFGHFLGIFGQKHEIFGQLRKNFGHNLKIFGHLPSSPEKPALPHRRLIVQKSTSYLHKKEPKKPADYQTHPLAP